MQKTTEKIYKFHCKIDSGMKKNLYNLPLFKKAGNLSGLINRILTLMSPGMEKKHLNNEQMMSRYELVSEDMEIPRENVFVYLPERYYRQLKSLHQDLNYYSMAQLLRWVLRVFLDLAMEFGDALESKLLELYLEWKKNRDTRKCEKRPVEELLQFSSREPEKSSFLTLYSKQYQPISIYLL